MSFLSFEEKKRERELGKGRRKGRRKGEEEKKREKRRREEFGGLSCVVVLLKKGKIFCCFKFGNVESWIESV